MLDDAFKVNDSLNGLVFHSDRGWQYQHKTYQYELARLALNKVCLGKAVLQTMGLWKALAYLKERCFMAKNQTMPI